MSGLIIDSEACIGCGRCVRACASGGIVVEGERPNRCARVTDGCILCGGCVDACPVNAISIEIARPLVRLTSMRIETFGYSCRPTSTIR